MVLNLCWQRSLNILKNLPCRKVYIKKGQHGIEFMLAEIFEYPQEFALPPGWDLGRCGWGAR